MPDDRPDAGANAQPPQWDRPPTRTVRTVLLVDDLELTLNAWEREFKQGIKDKQILRATCRSDALREAQHGHPDVAVVDLRLDGDNGLDVTRDLKALDPNLYVVVVSGHMTVDLTLAAVCAGADDVVAKPFRCRELIKRIESGMRLEPDLVGNNQREARSMHIVMLDERSDESEVSAVLYRRLLGLHTHDDPELLLDDAVRLIVELTGALLCIVQLFDKQQESKFWRGYGATNAALDVLRESISRGIVAHTLREQQTVLTMSATGDTRFADLDSVKQREIEAVLCAPIGADPPIGVVYLQARPAAGGFEDHDRELVELTAEHVAQVAVRFLGDDPRPLHEKAREFQRRNILDALQRHDWNVVAAAHELGISRSHLHDLIKRTGLQRAK